MLQSALLPLALFSSPNEKWSRCKEAWARARVEARLGSGRGQRHGEHPRTCGALVLMLPGW